MQQWTTWCNKGLLALTVLTLASASVGADDRGVPGKKLQIQDKSATTGKNSVDLILSKSPDIHKGANSPDGDPRLSGDLKLFVNGSSTAAATYDMPAIFWISNKNGRAQFKNTLAPLGGTPTKSVIIKDATLGKVQAKDLGGLNTAAIQSGDDIIAQITINNGNDAQTHRLCTKFNDVSVSVTGGNRKIVGVNGLPTACPSTPPLCGVSSVQHTFTVNSNSGGAFDSAEWPGGTDSHTFSAGCSVTINRPSGNIDLVGALGNSFSIAGLTGFSSCSGTGGEDGDGCNPSTCPPLGIGSCQSTRPSCSAALNGSGSATYTVQCNP